MSLTRRHLLSLAAGLPLACRGSEAVEAPAPQEKTMSKMPSIFLAHGAPPLLDDAPWVSQLAAWGKALPKPKSILMISAHWEDRPLSIGATRTVPLVYDFYGFPQRYYEVKYPAPGAPELAARVRELAAAAGIKTAESPDRGLDHGAYVPLVAMVPQADVPVLQISMPSLDPRELHRIGAALAPLRDEGVLVVGSGFLTHNMRAIEWGSTTPPSWAKEFDAWVGEVLARRDTDSLLDFLNKGPNARMAHPRTEHFVPVVVAEAMAGGDAASFPITGFTFGSFTKRSVQFG